jgi:hypothetical protein
MKCTSFSMQSRRYLLRLVAHLMQCDGLKSKACLSQVTAMKACLWRKKQDQHLSLWRNGAIDSLV